MSPVRIPYRPASVLPVGIPPLNLFRMWAHSPSTLPHAISLGTACFRDTSLSPYQRELVCLLNAQRLCCEYQCKQHIQIARTTGVSDSQIEALSAGDITADVWSNQEKALLAFVDAVITGPDVSDLVFDNARRCFSDQTLVEVVTMQGFYYSLARIATVFRVDLENSRGEAQRIQEVRNGQGS
ncbi:AhpD-like protein [Cadophora sp. MPI-SDFR-AT-0126]|nr:AhpD-like protein [Leotiomycetes sp. MPI-SDFR-AT-0126]